MLGASDSRCHTLRLFNPRCRHVKYYLKNVKEQKLYVFFDPYDTSHTK